MLRLIKKHLAACAKTSEKDWKCRPKDGKSKTLSCPFYIAGSDPRDANAPRIKKHSGTSNEQTARAVLTDFERSLFNPIPESKLEPTPEQPKLTIAAAIQFWIATKKHKSKDRQRRLKRQITEMHQWLKDTCKYEYITDVKKTDLETYMFSWSGAYNTVTKRRENMKSFWKYCYDSDFTPKNITASLPTIGDERHKKDQRIPTLAEDEIAQIFDAAERCHEVFRREDEKVAAQVRAFTFVERYTGMSIGDVTKLKKTEVCENKIVVSRQKTGEPVWTAVPQFVTDALHEMKHDSDEYFFWSGNGLLKTRTTKWGKRLQKLYAFSGVRIREEKKKLRSRGKLKDEFETVIVSSVTPHMWRHTFVRDHYLIDTPVEEIAELIGDDAETVRQHYSCFDVLRQKKLLKRQEEFWNADPYAKRIMSGGGRSATQLGTVQ